MYFSLKMTIDNSPVVSSEKTSTANSKELPDSSQYHISQSFVPNTNTEKALLREGIKDFQQCNKAAADILQ